VTIRVEAVGEPEVACDLRHGETILVAQLDHQAIGRGKRLHCRLERMVDLVESHRVLGAARRVADGREVDVVADEIDQSSACDQIQVVFRAVPTRPSRSAVSLPMMIETQALHHDHEPGRELTASIGDEGVQAAALILPKPLQHVRVAVHDRVVVTTQAACDMQQQPAVGQYELCPCRVTCPRLARVEQACDHCWDDVTGQCPCPSGGTRVQRTGSRPPPQRSQIADIRARAPPPQLAGACAVYSVLRTPLYRLPSHSSASTINRSCTGFPSVYDSVLFVVSYLCS